MAMVMARAMVEGEGEGEGDGEGDEDEGSSFRALGLGLRFGLELTSMPIRSHGGAGDSPDMTCAHVVRWVPESE